MLVDEEGFRLNVGIILAHANNTVLLGRRLGQDAWQFPQGGVDEGETPEQTMYRELMEELGLESTDVELLGCTRSWLTYRLPEQYIRKSAQVTVIGQKQKWFLLRLTASEQKIRLDVSRSPEFDSWRWVDYWRPVEEVIYFKRQVYQDALKELEPILLKP